MSENWTAMQKAALELATVIDVIEAIEAGDERARYWERSASANAYREQERANAMAAFRKASSAFKAERA